ncbi:MAG: hypothetical protein AABX03_02985 [Nanoarchaeota archaeon]
MEEYLDDMESGFKLAELKADHKNLTAKQEIQIERSFDLFKKHFFNLWD